MPWQYRFILYILGIAVLASSVRVVTMEYRCSELERRCEKLDVALKAEATYARHVAKWARLHMAFHDGMEKENATP